MLNKLFEFLAIKRREGRAKKTDTNSNMPTPALFEFGVVLPIMVVSIYCLLHGTSSECILSDSKAHLFIG